MKNLFLLPILLLALCSCNPNQAQNQEWIQLFNGENLEGWTIKMTKHPLGENYNNTFRVENGMMVTRYDQYENFDGSMDISFIKTLTRTIN